MTRAKRGFAVENKKSAAQILSNQRRRHRPNELDHLIADGVRAGRTAAETAAEAGVHPATVSKRAAALGLAFACPRVRRRDAAVDRAFRRR